ncbi:MAG TPA: alpha/beta fold hydrolase [Stellaceae bacterium]|nr:alpha/beta fold hydrolase [Stellaceae bacterium]
MKTRVSADLRGSGEPIVFLHGIGGGADSWAPQLDALSPRYRTIAWNMPGYHGSPALDAMTFPALAETLLGLLDDLGLDRVHLVGHSIGGMVAQEFAATWPHRLRSLVLSATSPAFGRGDGAFQRAFVAKRLEPLDNGMSMADLASGIVAELIGEDADPAGIELARRCMSAVPADAYRQAMRCLVTFDRRDALPGIAVPTLLIAGESDTNAPAPMMERMAGKIPGARFTMIPGAGHLANLERQHTFTAVLGEFIGNLA